jgi:hypothetical protein
MRNRFASKIRSRLGLTGQFRVRPGQTAAIELPPIAGYGPLPESSWVLVIALAIVVGLALAMN